ncbi:SLD2 [Candida oxycetoniae]|uniref:DNA replication regulator SLD2 n=1 Tax=Candida oxycetoniae TaxID=497107 RepID=A0AAI9SW43_9ASCO|nr:SLD2 [Candida oxycetoniae]KAI3403796.2 SLD2 [Candida oxycetoniae]
MCSDLLEIKQEIKNWEYSFRNENKRLPTKVDIDQNSEIKKLYSLYKLVKSGKQKEKNKPTRAAQSKAATKDKDEVLLIEIPPTPKGELGPTPQANGRVLSIFDFKLTPPESSPLKCKSKSRTTNTDTSIEDYLAAENGHAPISPNPNRGLSFSTPSKVIDHGSPIARATRNSNFVVMETPRYMKPNFQTPTFTKSVSLPEFSVSPSPLKPHRMMRKLTEVYKTSLKEAQDLKLSNEIDLDLKLSNEIDLDLKLGNEIDPNLKLGNEIDPGLKMGEANEKSEEDEKKKAGQETTRDVPPLNDKQKKQKTQKRQTRRAKMAPRPSEMDQACLDNINIHDTIMNLERKEKIDLTAYINSDNENAEEKDEVKEGEDDTFNAAQGSPIKRTRKPITQNYKRLKINDPRSRRFKQRMRR